MGMKPAFFLRLFPPPAACSGVFAFHYGASAGLAAYADVTLTVEGEVLYFVFGDRAEDLLISPTDEWIEFIEGSLLIPLYYR